MTPERAGELFRELLQTPPAELQHFGRRHGLQGHPQAPELEQAQELLRAIMVALRSGPGPNWQRVNDAWGAMRAKHGRLELNAAGPQAPAWIGQAPAKPSLGDPAPGTSGQAQQQVERQRFVPSAKPQIVAPGISAGMPPPPPPPPQPSPQGWQQGHNSYPPPPPAHGLPPVPPTPGAQPHAHAAHAQPGYAQQAAHPSGYGAHQSAQPTQPTGGAYAQHPQAYAQPAPQQAAPAQPAGARPPPPPRRQPAAEAIPVATAVSTYAAFCAACAAFPQRVADTQREYGLADDAARQRLDEDWADRFDDDPDLHVQWERMFAQFREQLRQRQR